LKKTYKNEPSAKTNVWIEMFVDLIDLS